LISRTSGGDEDSDGDYDRPPESTNTSAKAEYSSLLPQKNPKARTEREPQSHINPIDLFIIHNILIPDEEQAQD
jgi:hypothetical protein